MFAPISMNAPPRGRNRSVKAVIDAFPEQHADVSYGFDPARLSAAGYAEHHPRVPNDSPENRARRRPARTVGVPTPGGDPCTRTAPVSRSPSWRWWTP